MHDIAAAQNHGALVAQGGEPFSQVVHLRGREVLVYAQLDDGDGTVQWDARSEHGMCGSATHLTLGG